MDQIRPEEISDSDNTKILRGNAANLFNVG
jgi:hypothetical protein